MRIIFAGTPDFAATHLGSLIGSEHELVAVYSQPDRPAGRGKKLRPSPVKQLALEHGLKVLQPDTLRAPQAQLELQALAADLLIVVAYGLILPAAVLTTPTYGCINVHASLLPRWRGAAPIQRAIEAGDAVSGITIMQMDEGLDTGDILATTEVSIGDSSAADLQEQLARRGPPLLLQVLSGLPAYQRGAQQQQEEGTTYAHKITKAEAEIDWSEPATLINRKVRAFNPFPIAFTQVQGQRLKIWRLSVAAYNGTAVPGTIVHADKSTVQVSCGEASVLLQQLQLPGGKALKINELLNARSELFAVGSTLHREVS